MNAKKIMGAVLVALLAAALFVGAGAAVDADPLAKFNGKTVFVYQEVAGLAGTTWNNGANSITFDADGVVSGKNIVEGAYVNGENTIYVKYPTAAITAIANNASVKYPVMGGTYYKGSADWINLSIVSPAGAAITNLLVTLPDGTQMKAWEILPGMATLLSNGGVLDFADDSSLFTTIANGTVKVALDKENQNEIFKQTGTYKIQAIFAVEGTKVINGGNEYTLPTTYPLVDYIPDEYLVAKDVYTFTVVGDDQEVAISASVDKVLAGKTFTVTITGMPGKYYVLDAADDASFEIVSAAGANTINTTVGADYGKFQMPNGGSITVYVKSSEDDEITLKVGDAEVTIEILKATLTATIGAPSYIIGEEIEVTLTTDGELADKYYFTITGTNLKETPITNTSEDNVYKLNTKSVGKELDVGTYTIKIYSDANMKTLVATVPVALKQPLISIIEAPEVVVQNKDAKFIINAEATKNITAYVFGTNFFENLVMGDNITIKDTKNAPNKFTVTLKDNLTKNMSTGQYFAVFQHPMYDGNFNIGAKGSDIVLNETANVYADDAEYTILFNVSKRQTANAAQALCDALESQNIDDMYVKASFFVVGKDESFTISEIPTTIAQGETLTISGVSTANADGTVTVEMISTAFAAVPKETVGSAAFIAVSTKVAEDGTWEITMDTSDLNVDEYSLKVAVTPANGGETETWKNVNINVVEGADEPVNPEQPEEPGQDEPEEPVAPATPGFGALAALAGLGAVAVLLLRRE